MPRRTRSTLVAFAQLPDGATLDRTDAVVRRMTEVAMQHPGVLSSVAFPGLSINGFVNASNAGIAFVVLKPAEERTTPDLSANAIVGALNQAFYAEIPESIVAIFPPPPVQGLGTVGGFKLYVEDRTGAGFEELYTAAAGQPAEGT
ncbi:MAG: efflux RND transporter permease subunit [Vicinamibacterales bacterium]